MKKRPKKGDCHFPKGFRRKRSDSHLMQVLFAFVLLLAVVSCSPRLGVIAGTVVDEGGLPLPEAVVRVKATGIETLTNQEGQFLLTGLTPGQPVFVTAWFSGYYINGVEGIQSGMQDVEIVLQAHHDSDNPDYAWLPSTYHESQGENQGCAECHSMGDSAHLPVDEWLLDAHSQSALNPRFITMYTGTDIFGNQSPVTRYTINRDYGRFPLRPDPEQPYFGPGYKLDFPDTTGNCAACHTPLAAIDNPYSVNPTQLTGVETEGVSCDFCHKIWGVRLNPTTNLPFPNMPGVLSFEFRRPPEGHQFFAGPLDDVAPGEDTYSHLQTQSQICAPCHFGVFWDTQVYNSFGEWLASPYSDPETGQTCQDCHMPPLGNTHFARPEMGGRERDPATIFSHRMPGAGDEELLQNAVSLDVKAQIQGDQVLVNITITNDKTGHHVPTDSPLRQIILLVQATGPDGSVLELLDGPVLPDWAGIGDPAQGYYAGLPGHGYAKILSELWTEISPTGAYWNPTRILSDNRIPAMESDTTRYTFSAPVEGEANIAIRLLYRRAFIELMNQKSWDVADIIMTQNTLRVP